MRYRFLESKGILYVKFELQLENTTQLWVKSLKEIKLEVSI